MAWQQALDHQEALYTRDGHDRPTLPGEEIPVITQDLVDAGDRVDVLEHQLDALRARIHRSGNAR